MFRISGDVVEYEYHHVLTFSESIMPTVKDKIIEEFERLNEPPVNEGEYYSDLSDLEAEIDELKGERIELQASIKALQIILGLKE